MNNDIEKEFTNFKFCPQCGMNKKCLIKGHGYTYNTFTGEIASHIIQFCCQCEFSIDSKAFTEKDFCFECKKDSIETINLDEEMVD